MAGGYRPEAATAGALVAWPDAFGQRFTICVDTEEDFDWSQPLSGDQRATGSSRALPEAARRFAGLGAWPTYLVDHPIATDARAIEALRSVLADGRSAVGTQLHPWVNPPFADTEPAAGFPGALPRSLEAAKLDVLTGAIARAFGTRPIIYRAGRYGMGRHSLSLLAERGYRFDTSMRARYDYSDGGGPDFRGVGNDAFRTGPGGAIIELPLTTIHTGLLRRWAPGIEHVARRLPRATGALARLGLLSRVALSPEDMPLRDALEAVEVAAGEGTALLNFSFHSPSLEPGHTPYVRDAADLAAFWGWWDAVVARLAQRGIAHATLGEIDAAAARGRPGRT